MNIRPLGDRIAVRLIEPPTQSDSGIYLGAAPADDGLVKKIVEGEVIAVGPGRNGQGMWGIEPRHVISFSPVGSASFEIDGCKVTMTRLDAVVGVHA